MVWARRADGTWGNVDATISTATSDDQQPEQRSPPKSTKLAPSEPDPCSSSVAQLAAAFASTSVKPPAPAPPTPAPKPKPASLASRAPAKGVPVFPRPASPPVITPASQPVPSTSAIPLPSLTSNPLPLQTSRAPSKTFTGPRASQPPTQDVNEDRPPIPPWQAELKAARRGPAKVMSNTSLVKEEVQSELVEEEQEDRPTTPPWKAELKAAKVAPLRPPRALPKVVREPTPPPPPPPQVEMVVELEQDRFEEELGDRPPTPPWKKELKAAKVAPKRPPRAPPKVIRQPTPPPVEDEYHSEEERVEVEQEELEEERLPTSSWQAEITTPAPARRRAAPPPPAVLIRATTEPATQTPLIEDRGPPPIPARLPGIVAAPQLPPRRPPLPSRPSAPVTPSPPSEHEYAYDSDELEDAAASTISLPTPSSSPAPAPITSHRPPPVRRKSQNGPSSAKVAPSWSTDKAGFAKQQAIDFARNRRDCLNPPPDCFSRRAPPESELDDEGIKITYAHLEAPIILRSNNSNDLAKAITTGRAFPSKPHPLLSHDVHRGDWDQLWDDIDETARIELRTSAGLSVATLPLMPIFGAGFAVSTLAERKLRAQRVGPTCKLVETWNVMFFRPRRLDVYLAQDSVRLSGPYTYSTSRKEVDPAYTEAKAATTEAEKQRALRKVEQYSGKFRFVVQSWPPSRD
ncbi:hypothetical protein T439DRAFT_382471 [Meredithblackwellia eburnea MCA 4105]